MITQGMDQKTTRRFFVLGGECNYLCQCNNGVLEPVEYEDRGRALHLYPSHSAQYRYEHWATAQMKTWSAEAIKYEFVVFCHISPWPTLTSIRDVLSAAKTALTEGARRLKLDVKLVEKERSVGLVPKNPSKRIAYEMWEDLALHVQEKLKPLPIPTCAFNGNLDVFVDIGDKKHGVLALQGYLGIEKDQTMHFGDRFTATGNDVAVREVALTIWVANSSETCEMLAVMLKDLGMSIRPYVPPTDSRLPSSSVLTSAWGIAASEVQAAPAPPLSVPNTIPLGIVARTQSPAPKSPRFSSAVSFAAEPDEGSSSVAKRANSFANVIPSGKHAKTTP